MSCCKQQASVPIKTEPGADAHLLFRVTERVQLRIPVFTREVLQLMPYHSNEGSAYRELWLPLARRRLEDQALHLELDACVLTRVGVPQHEVVDANGDVGQDLRHEQLRPRVATST